jgi:predicted PurR-regulated permease PerM
MIALALLFIVIIGLLSVIVWLLQKYFEMYSSLHTSESNQTAELQSHLYLQKSKMEILQTEEEINTLINKWLTEMEEKFPTEQPQDELCKKTNILGKNFSVIILVFCLVFYTAKYLFEQLVAYRNHGCFFVFARGHQSVKKFATSPIRRLRI